MIIRPIAVSKSVVQEEENHHNNSTHDPVFLPTHIHIFSLSLSFSVSLSLALTPRYFYELLAVTWGKTIWPQILHPVVEKSFENWFQLRWIPSKITIVESAVELHYSNY